MEYKLNVAFAGACGFVRPPKAGKPLQVLLPDGREPWSLVGHHSHIVPDHLAYIRVGKEYVVDRDWRKTRFTYQENGQDIDLYPLAGDVITLSPSIDQSIYLKEDVPANASVPDTTGDASSLHWLVNLSKICNQWKLDPKLLSDPLDPKLVARVDINGGLLETDYVGRDTESTFEPAPDTGPDFSRCLASQIRLSTRVTTAQVRLKVGADTLTLASVNGRFEVEIGNAPFAELLLGGSDTRHQLDYHFSLLYKLMIEPSGKHAMHLPKAKAVPKEGKKTSDCHGALLER